jgi:hypothetical protein
MLSNTFLRGLFTVSPYKLSIQNELRWADCRQQDHRLQRLLYQRNRNNSARAYYRCQLALENWTWLCFSFQFVLEKKKFSVAILDRPWPAHFWKILSFFKVVHSICRITQLASWNYLHWSDIYKPKKRSRPSVCRSQNILEIKFNRNLFWNISLKRINNLKIPSIFIYLKSKLTR